MKPKVLLVDDDANLLAGCERHLRRQFEVTSALGGEAALHSIDTRGPFAVVVSDMRMPNMDGARFLSLVKERSPDSVRIMLTGNADLDTAIKVVNQSNIFRFLTKPCPPDYLAKAIEDGARQHELVTSEKELLENTLTGSIRVMTEILALMDPKSFDRALALRGLMMTLGKALRVPALWELSAASLLSQIGATAIPQSVLVKQRSQQTLTAIEKDVVTRIPEIGHKLLVNIPRLENVARVVLYQSKHFDGSGFPEDTIAGDAIPLGSRMMFLLKDLAQIRIEGTPLSEAFNSVRSRTGFYDPKVVDAAFSCFINPIAFARPVEKELAHILAKDLRIGHVLMDNIVTKDGILLISSGHVISGATLEKIRNFTIITGIKEPIAVENPTPGLTT